MEAGIDTAIRESGSRLTGMYFAIPIERILKHRVVGALPLDEHLPTSGPVRRMAPCPWALLGS